MAFIVFTLLFCLLFTHYLCRRLDYYQRWGVVIEKYPDKIVISNPGNIRVGEQQMLKGGISEPRNKNMLKMFNLIGIGEHAGSGVPDIFKDWKIEGLKEPTIEEVVNRDQPDRTTITMPLVSNFTTSLGTSGGEVSGEAGGEVRLEDETKVIDYCQTPRSKKDIQEYLDIKSERYVREKIINPMLNNGTLFRTIPDKPRSPKQKYVSNKKN